MSAAPPTDAQGHRSVLASQAVGYLITDPDGTYVDATFGRGGHARLILQRLGPAGRLLALDRDPAAVTSAMAFTDPRFHIEHTTFSRLDAMLAACGIDRVQGVLLDVGVSSPQIDDAARGFSWRGDGPLECSGGALAPARRSRQCRSVRPLVAGPTRRTRTQDRSLR